ncbi:MAG: Na+/H+ antiporter NhaC family protein [Prevotellaceae bacterium]|jgi:Na+/H+ antiporter NhaC|nr:Na+/H+ antiporter NhaC family protein [Prevotellaceae bacterium]
MDVDKEIKEIHKPDWKALLPLGVFFLLYILTFIFTGSLQQMPISVAFLIASAVAILFSKGGKISKHIDIFCRGCANDTILLMIVIFILAGAFAGTAKAMGAVDATVNMALYLLPETAIMASIFVAACFISMSMGTSCGTIAALAPIAAGISSQTGLSVPIMVGIVVGGAMFGDNLSYISDTTIVATRTQNCRMKDKFKANFRLVFPAAMFVLAIYIFQGLNINDINGGVKSAPDMAEWIKVIPYIVVLLTALAGVNVVAVLSVGIVLSGIIGIFSGEFTVWKWAEALSGGIVNDMGELIIVSLMAGGMFEMIRYNGGIDWLIIKLTKNIRSERKAETAIAGLVSFTDICTANNTIAIIISGPIAKQISEKAGLKNRRTASILDTFSCFVQSCLPYGAQLLIASGLAGINPMEIIPYLYYPFAMGFMAIMSIVLKMRKTSYNTPK